MQDTLLAPHLARVEEAVLATISAAAEDAQTHLRAAEDRIETLQAERARADGETPALAGVPTSELEQLLEHSQRATARIKEHLDERLQQERVCAICMERAKNTALVPCGHFSCAECAARRTECYICRGAIAQRLRTYGD